MATDPMGEWAGPLPIPPAPQGNGGGYNNPALITEPPGAGPAASPRSPSGDRRAQLERTMANPLYRFGSALAGSNPAAEEMRGLQGQDLQERQFALQQKQFQAQMDQFVTSKKLALGGMAVQFLEKVASAKPDQRAALVEIGGQFLGPMLKEIGFELPVNLLKRMTDTPGLATRFGALIADNFQDEASQKQVLGEISALDEKDIPDYVAKRWKQAQDAALPRVQQALIQATKLVRSDPARMANLGLLDEKGKPKPIPGQMLLGLVDGWFKTSAEKAMALRVLGTSEHSPFLASIGIQPGTLSEEQMKIVGAAEATAGTPRGAAELRTAEAGATTAEAKAGMAGRQEAATTTKAEADAKYAAPQAQATLAQTRATTAKTAQETAASAAEAGMGKASDVAGLRKEFGERTKDFATLRDAYAKVEDVAKSGTPAGDISLLYGFMKLNDPGSTVREGEYATAQNAAGVPERIQALYNKAVDGSFLTPKMRADFVKQAKTIFEAQLKTHEETEDTYRGLAKGRGWREEEVVPDFVGRFRKRQRESDAAKPKPTMTGEPVRAR